LPICFVSNVSKIERLKITPRHTSKTILPSDMSVERNYETVSTLQPRRIPYLIHVPAVAEDHRRTPPLLSLDRTSSCPCRDISEPHDRPLFRTYTRGSLWFRLMDIQGQLRSSCVLHQLRLLVFITMLALYPRTRLSDAVHNTLNSQHQHGRERG